MARLVVCGAINWDTSCFVEHLPSPGEEVTIKRITRVSGGTGANVAVAAARILGHDQVALIAALGKDETAYRQISALEAEGVITMGIKLLPEEESGQAYILIDKAGQNVIASHLGANARLFPKYLDKQSVEWLLQECQGIVLTDPPLDTAAELLNLAKGRGIPALWDPGILTSHSWETLDPLARGAEVIFLNEAEAATLFGTAEPQQSLQYLQRQEFRKYIVLKLGANGAAMLEPATGTVLQVPSLPLKDLGLDIVSTVGCGDVFAGVFAAYYVLEADIRKSLIMASTAAGLNATSPETRGGPDRVTLEAMEKRSRALGFK